MIERYTREEMAKVWEEKNKLKKWLEVEILVCEAYNKMGLLSDEGLKKIKEGASFSLEEVKEREKITRHDVAAFVDVVTKNLGDEGRFIHLGLTSSDILDTAFSLQLLEASDIILRDIKELMDVLKKKAFEYKDLVVMGRTHGVHAEPVTLGMKMALWYDEMRRNKERMERAREEVRVGKISGAVGTYAHIDPFIENYVCEKLGLKPCRVSSQIIQRDIHAYYMATLAVIAGTIEKIALEVRNLQRTEVLEVEEPFSKGQKGSSAMPHKRNPILSENLCGLSRVVRGNLIGALENIALWHERDISHSSVERVIFPDSTILIDFMLNRLKGILENLRVNKDKIERNLWLTKGLFFSQKLLTELVKKGLQRDQAYRMVQEVAMRCWDEDLDFREEVLKSGEIKKIIPEEELKKLFDLSTFTKHIDYIFQRVFSE